MLARFPFALGVGGGGILRGLISRTAADNRALGKDCTANQTIGQKISYSSLFFVNFDQVCHIRRQDQSAVYILPPW